MARPAIFVLAGVNGAGKSSVGGALLQQGGLTWFNPDTFARRLVSGLGMTQVDANINAWSEGVRRLDAAIAQGRSFAFETTLGGGTIVAKLIEAHTSHDILVWFCALRDAEQHIARVAFRVSQGGHDIPEEKIRQRCQTSMLNMLRLLPYATTVHAYDNSTDVAPGESIPDPQLVLHVHAGRCLYPVAPGELRRTPDWAKPLVQAALNQQSQSTALPPSIAPSG